MLPKIYSKDNLRLTENSYSSILIMSVLIAGAALTCLLDGKLPEIINNKKGLFYMIPIILIFIVFAINIWVSGNISNHISAIYKLLGGTGRHTDNKQEQLEASSIYHDSTRNYMNWVLQLSWYSLPIFIVSIYWLVLIRYKITNTRYLIVWTSIVLLILVAFIAHKYHSHTVLNMINKKIIRKHLIIYEEENEEENEEEDAEEEELQSLIKLTK